MSLTTLDTWERVINFGRHTHIIKDEKTLCGRDTSNSRSLIQKFPQKRCKRCIEIRTMIKQANFIWQ